MTRIDLPDIPKEDRSPVINMLLKVIEQQQFAIEKLESEVSNLKNEIKRLKKHKERSKIKPSKMDKEDSGSNGGGGTTKRPGSAKRNKTSQLDIHKTEIIKAEDVPSDAKFKGYDTFIVQEKTESLPILDESEL